MAVGAPGVGGEGVKPAGEIKEGFSEEVASNRRRVLFYYSLDSYL